MYRFIKEYYYMGLYTSEDLQLFVSVAWITEEEKQEIIANE